MNYGKKGITKIQKSLTSKSVKLKKMCCVAALKLILIALLAFCIIGYQRYYPCRRPGHKRPETFTGCIYHYPAVAEE